MEQEQHGMIVTCTMYNCDNKHSATLHKSQDGHFQRHAHWYSVQGHRWYSVQGHHWYTVYVQCCTVCSVYTHNVHFLVRDLYMNIVINERTHFTRHLLQRQLQMYNVQCTCIYILYTVQRQLQCTMYMCIWQSLRLILVHFTLKTVA